MKIPTADQVRKADDYTIQNGDMTSLELMEKASLAFSQWFLSKFKNLESSSVLILCGNGNNGGDGAAIGRIIHEHVHSVEVLVLEYMPESAPDFTSNLNRLPEKVQTHRYRSENDLPAMNDYDFILDALWGSGLSRPIEEPGKSIIKAANRSKATRVSVDIPSGLHSDLKIDSVKFQADFTCAFEFPKLSFFLKENIQWVGEWSAVPIGLSSEFISTLETKYEITDLEKIRPIVKSRDSYGYKNTFGHSLIIAGSTGKFGASLLAGKSCLVSGSGLVTIHIPSKGMASAHSYVPECMLSVDKNPDIISKVTEDLNDFDAVGIGPGLGQDSATISAFKDFLNRSHDIPMVIDADAINMLAQDPDLLNQVPANSILTPHPGEFQRLFGKQASDYEMLDTQVESSVKYSVYIVRKGKYTAVSCPDGKCFFNQNGNVALATAGSGDVLTGIITSLLAQGYSPADSCLLGVFVHGAAADKHVELSATDRMIASQIIHLIPSILGELLS